MPSTRNTPSALAYASNSIVVSVCGSLAKDVENLNIVALCSPHHSAPLNFALRNLLRLSWKDADLLLSDKLVSATSPQSNQAYNAA